MIIHMLRSIIVDMIRAKSEFVMLVKESWNLFRKGKKEKEK